MGTFKCKLSQFLIQPNSQMNLILNKKYLNASHQCSDCRSAISEILLFLSIAQVFKSHLLKYSVYNRIRAASVT